MVNLQKARVAVDEEGFVKVSNTLRTNVPHIWAVGDVAGRVNGAHSGLHTPVALMEVSERLLSLLDSHFTRVTAAGQQVHRFAAGFGSTPPEVCIKGQSDAGYAWHAGHGGCAFCFGEEA